MLDSPINQVRTEPLVPLTTRLGPVHIGITEAECALAVWRDIVGLSLISQNQDRLELGVGETVLIVLEIDASMPVQPNTLGLYHVAIHVPERADLARFVVRASQAGLRVSPTDHLVSEAVYAWDSDGNGIEVTFETPWRGTFGDGSGSHFATTNDGEPHSGREPIDLTDLLSELGDDPDAGTPLKAGTRIGHVHVHVTDLDVAMRFYRDVLGFAGSLLMREWGMGDVSLDYAPHILAFNVWAGRSAQRPARGAAGLRHFTIIMPDAASFQALARRLSEAGIDAAEAEGWLDLTDPFGNAIRIGVSV